MLYVHHHSMNWQYHQWFNIVWWRFMIHWNGSRIVTILKFQNSIPIPNAWFVKNLYQLSYLSIMTLLKYKLLNHLLFYPGMFRRCSRVPEACVESDLSEVYMYVRVHKEDTVPAPTVTSVDRLRTNLILSAKPLSAMTWLAHFATGRNACEKRVLMTQD